MVKTFIFFIVKASRTGKKHKIIEYSKLLAEKLFCRFTPCLYALRESKIPVVSSLFDRIAKNKDGHVYKTIARCNVRLKIKTHKLTKTCLNSAI